MAYSTINFISRLQKWMDSDSGQTFLNYAYSWGAAIVILGTLFKLTHMPGANIFLFLGMGTEVIVFIISAFDRPFEKNDGSIIQDGKIDGNRMEGKRMTAQNLMTQTMEKINQATTLSDILPCNKQTEELKERLIEINELYKQHLAKANEQTATIDNIDRTLNEMYENIEHLNRVYTQMVAALN